MESVAVICAYFGKLPGCFKPWLKSCQFNPLIDFLLFTDQTVENHPKNVHIIKKSFADIQALVNEKLNRKVALAYPYKLCDLKPMYGLIFEDYLSEYDYWGHCDMDLVFGDIRYFLEKYDLDKYDKFLDLGHLSLYRNTCENNLRFKGKGSICGDFETVLSDERGHAFDERNGIYQIYKANGYPIFDKRIYADIAMIYKRFRCALKDKNYTQQIFYWENGKVYRSFYFHNKWITEEFIYIHFKKRGFAAPKFDVDTVNAFYIGPYGFTNKEVEVNPTIEEIKKYNPYNCIDEKTEMAVNFIKNDVKAFLGRCYRKKWKVGD